MKEGTDRLQEGKGEKRARRRKRILHTFRGENDAVCQASNSLVHLVPDSPYEPQIARMIRRRAGNRNCSLDKGGRAVPLDPCENLAFFKTAADVEDADEVVASFGKRDPRAVLHLPQGVHHNRIEARRDERVGESDGGGRVVFRKPGEGRVEPAGRGDVPVPSKLDGAAKGGAGFTDLLGRLVLQVEESFRLDAKVFEEL